LEDLLRAVTALMKILYVAIFNATQKWTTAIHIWSFMINALILDFNDKIESNIKE